MGLDMYAYTRRQDENYEDRHDIHYWRKFNALHGWMERLYREKGGDAESFNCVEVELTIVDLLRLQSDALEDKLTPTPGFFFGSQRIHSSDRESVFKFVAEALSAICNGEKVYYNSWW